MRESISERIVLYFCLYMGFSKEKVGKKAELKETMKEVMRRKEKKKNIYIYIYVTASQSERDI